MSCFDNQGVLHNILSGSSRSSEMNILVGRMWLVLAHLNTYMFAARVESKSNVADGPTRDDLYNVIRVKATYVAPIWPQWTVNMWNARP